jgi:hypothetical protein
MWAMTNRHKGIAKSLLDNGASVDQRTSSGRTAADFVAPNSEMSYYLHDSGYNIGSVATDDFYSPGFSQDRFEEEMAENELRRRMMMESARDLEVDLGNVGIDDQPEVGSNVDQLHEQKQTDTGSPWMNLMRKSSKNSTGPDVATTRCLSSRNRNWVLYSTLLLRR